MALSPILTPVAMLLERVICVLGLYAGYAKKKIYGYLFAVTFLLFGLFDYIGQIGLDADTLFPREHHSCPLRSLWHVSLSSGKMIPEN